MDWNEDVTTEFEDLDDELQMDSKLDEKLEKTRTFLE